MSEYHSKAANEPSEPLFTVGSVTAAGSAIIALVVAFGLPISDAQQTAILGLIGVVAPIVVAAWGRRRVYSPATVARLTRRT